MRSPEKDSITNSDVISSTSHNVKNKTNQNIQKGSPNNHDADGKMTIPSSLPPTKLVATAAACIAAACIIYPAEMFRLSFINKSLATWDFEALAQSLKNGVNYQIDKKNVSTRDTLKGPFGFALSPWGRKKQKIRIVVSPFVRLVSNEMILMMMTNATNTSKTLGYNSIVTNNNHDRSHNHLMKEVTAGAISGFFQALLLCPLEIHRANQIMNTEEQERMDRSWRHWVRWTKLQLFEGGTGDPKERRKRAFQAIGTLALREMVFNVTFFPLFRSLMRYMDNQGSVYLGSRSKTLKTITSGAISGLICSFIATPLDVFKTYMLYSREQWNVWTGKSIIGPPYKLLFRGMTIQAMLFGPTFGIVAAIYELT